MESRLGLRSEIEAKGFACRSAKYLFVFRITSKARACVCGHPGVLARIGKSAKVLVTAPLSFVYFLWLLARKVPDESNAPFGDA